MKAFTAEVAATGNAVSVVLAGELDLRGADEFRSIILAALSRYRPARIVLNLRLLRFLDSTGIGAIVAGRNAALRQGATFVVTHPQGRVRETLAIVGVLDALTGHPDPPRSDPSRSDTSRSDPSRSDNSRADHGG